MGVKGGRAGPRHGPPTGSQRHTVRLGLNFPTCEKGRAHPPRARELAGVQNAFPSRQGGAALGGEGRAGVANAG